jgi:hypothetical protein
LITQQHHYSVEKADLEARARRNSQLIGEGRFPPARLAFDAYMHTAGLPVKQQDTTGCIKALKCRPFGGHSVWASLAAPVTNTTRVVMAVSSLDSMALFSQHATGGDADVSGVVTLLAAAMALSSPTPTLTTKTTKTTKTTETSSLELDKLPRRIVFAFFAGEAYDYVGSRKFVDDITTLQCKTVKKRQEKSAANPHGVRLYPAADGAAYTEAKAVRLAAID